ncbi:MAG: hypothetical protein EAZ89_13165, partial [Bacteroidetes bacterium]
MQSNTLLRPFYILALSCLAFGPGLQPLYATHNLAGQITAVQNDPSNPNSYEITVTTYTDPAPAGVDRCSADIEIWTLGVNPIRLALIEDVPRANGGPLANPPSDCSINNPRAGVEVKGTVKKNLYITTFIFPGAGEYDIFYYDIARHGSVVNINNPEEQAFFVGTRLFITPPIIGSNNTPRLLNEPLDDACAGKLWTHNPGGFDPDGDSLSYSLVPSYHYDPAQSNFPIIANGYRWPDDASFGVSSFTMDSITGLVTWNVPLEVGIYNFGYKVEEWRNGQLLGYVIRDMAVWVKDCPNNPPVIETIQDTCVRAGDTLKFNFKAWDPDLSDSLYLELNNAGIGINGPFSTPNPPVINGRVVDSIPGNSFNFTGLPVSTKNNGIAPVDTIKGTLTWITDCDNIRSQPYQVDFYASDNKNYSLPNSVTTTLTANKAVVIRVIPPAPEALTATKGSRTITLSWLPTPCGDRVQGYNIYRILDSSSWMQDSICCDMKPIDAGFTLVAYQSGWTNTTFVDSLRNLSGALGEKICYVITAMYDVPQLRGFPILESCATNVACVEINNEPIYLTNDSVSVTSAATGQIFLSWSQPAIDSFFPKPYIYRIFRANNNTYPAIRIADRNYSDTTYFDLNLDTEIRGYNYRVEVYDALGLLVNTSEDTHIGSSIYLVAQGGGNNFIDLEWKEYVPWANSSYEVYRSEAGGAFVLIATVTGTGGNVHTYRDPGLNPSVEYCYFIRSVGSHNQPDIKDPLINDSQVSCDFARDDEPPCPPEVSAEGSCTDAQHRVTLRKSLLGCDADADSLVIMFTEQAGGPFIVVARLSYSDFGQDTTLLIDVAEAGVAAAGCYTVTVSDTLGNV